MSSPIRTPVEDIFPDETNPRKSDDARMHLLRLSLQKMGFVQPIFADKSGMILSGHQRHTQAIEIGFETVPVVYVNLSKKQSKGINVLFNRATNDFTAFDTGKTSQGRIEIHDLMAMAENLEDWPDEDFLAYGVEIENIEGLGSSVADKWNRKAMLVASSLRRNGIEIPIVLTESGEIVNGVHRLFEARHEGVQKWPVVRIPDELGELALNLLNYLSMDYAVDGEFSQMLRYSAYRRPQNARGRLPKGMRFWAAGERTIKDAAAYSSAFWANFRSIHGETILDFGCGLGRAVPALVEKGFDAYGFEPYRIPGADVPVSERVGDSGSGRSSRRRRSRSDGGEGPGRSSRRRRQRGHGRSGDADTGVHAADSGAGTDSGGSGTAPSKPDPELSRRLASDFIEVVGSGKQFDSIFLASVLNSIPFPRDRQCVLAIVHSLCAFDTLVFGTCRDISDFLYEYSGIRNASYFVFDSEPGVRLGDALSNPKIQKFHSQEEFRGIAAPFWNVIDTWPGGNIFYWRAGAPKRINPKALAAALEFEFDLPYADGTTMGLAEEAKAAWSERLGIKL